MLWADWLAHVIVPQWHARTLRRQTMRLAWRGHALLDAGPQTGLAGRSWRERVGVLLVRKRGGDGARWAGRHVS